MYFRKKIIRYCVEQKLNISVQTYADFWRIGHFNDTILYTGGLSGTSAWGSILNTSVKRPNKRQRGRILNQQWDTDKSSAFNFSNNDNIWRKIQSIPNIVTFFSSLAIKFKHNFNRNMAKTRWKMTFNDFLPPPSLTKSTPHPPKVKSWSRHWLQCYSDTRLLGFETVCKCLYTCWKLSNGHVTHECFLALWKILPRRTLIWDLNDAMVVKSSVH